MTATTSDSGALAAGKGPLAAALAFLLFTLYCFSITLVPIRGDNDCWWHVKTGQYIAENGLPKYDVFSYTAADHEWHNHEWLSQLVYYAAFRIGEETGFGGWRAVILLVGVLLWGCYALLFWLAGRLSGSWWIALLVVALAIAIGRRTFYPRPPAVSNLLLAGQLFLLVAVAEGWIRRGWVFLLVPVIALWTNLHGAWMAGGVVLAAFALDQALTHWRDRLPRLPFERTPALLSGVQLGLLLPLCLLATLANPYGWKLYELPARVMSDRELVRAIGELQPPDFYFVIDFEMALHAAFLLALLLTRFRPRLFEVLIWLFFLHQAIQHVRHMLLFSVMMVPLYARLAGAAAHAARESLGEWAERIHPARANLAHAAPFAGIFLVAVYTMGWVVVNPREGGQLKRLFDRESFPSTYIQRNMQYFSGSGYIRERYPAALADFIQLAELEGNMFNENYYAGYLIWRLSPEHHRVFSDPRFDIFGGTIWQAERIIAAGAEEAWLPAADGAPARRTSWHEELDRYDVQWLITREGTGLERALHRTSGDWVRAANWPALNWQIWIRNTSENAAMIQRAQATAPLAGAD